MNDKEIIGYLIDGTIYDLHNDINNKNNPIIRNSIFGLQIIRHSCAHIMAQAIKFIFSEHEINFAVGPITDNGFYYDFEILDKNNNNINISIKDLINIENEMKNIISKNINFNKKNINKNTFLEKNQDRFKEIIINENIKTEEISIYTQGDFSDLCKGPHVISSGVVGMSFKLISVSEVTWKNYKVQRIEGICFANDHDLKTYEDLRATQESNDHKKLGKTMDLYSFSPLSPGFAFWHPNGLFIKNQIKQIIRSIAYKDFYEYETPNILKQELWEKTGHLANYKDNMFLLDDLALKPMNCPCHVLLFKESSVSYKDLPLRIAEFGSCFRNEEHGGLNGLKRVRSLTQDDGHIFCSLDQIENEIRNFLLNVDEIYKIFGFKEYIIKLATRPVKKIGSDDLWDKAEECLKNSLKDKNYILVPGDGAFYGPKIEIHLKDNLGRLWQCGTIQVDFFLANRLGAEYTDKDNSQINPIILHRAILGSIERFVAILVENGLPLWLKPIQLSILPISEKFNNYCLSIQNKLNSLSIRSIIDDSNDTLNKKIKKSLENKIDISIVIGQKELDNNQITVRYKNENQLIDLNKLPYLFDFHR